MILSASFVADIPLAADRLLLADGWGRGPVGKVQADYRTMIV